MAKRKVTKTVAETSKISLGKPEQILNELDPNLQEVILADKAKEPHDPNIARMSDDGRILVDVIAKLKDADVDVPGLEVVRKISNIVTGTVAVEDIELVRRHANVTSLKRATEVHRELGFSVSEIEATAPHLNGVSANPVDGNGVIVGVVDFDFDFQHNNFRNADGSTRLLFLWDQQGGASSMSPQGFGYGREFTADMINAALQTSDPYGALAYEPEEEAHGTHVSDIAAGNGRATGRSGVAPGASIIFVQLHGGDFREEESFGNSRTLLEAVDYIFEKARQMGRPAVVNLSLGTHGGPHDGSTLAEQGFDALLEEPGRAIVIAAGNSWGRKSHASGVVTASTNRSLGWEIRQGDATTNELEVWYQGGRSMDVSLVTPGGTRLGPVRPGTTVPLQSAGQRVGSIISRVADPNNSDNQINIILSPQLPKGTWRVELSTSEPSEIPFHAWIERDDRGQSSLSEPDNDPTHTIGSISCGERTIVVGSYMPTVLNRDISRFSSEGPTRRGREKPEVSAPGDQILAAASRTQGAVRMSGTSMAAPHVTGAIALLMHVGGSNMTADQIRQALITTARKQPQGGSGWQSRFGFGRISARSALLTQVSQPVSAITKAIERQMSVANSEAEPSAWMDGLLERVTNTAHRSRSRIRVEIEVEPMDK
jgi:subtilisin family serine protease